MADVREILNNGRVVARFWAKVTPAGTNDCWIWKDAPDDDGYGRLIVKTKAVHTSLRAHRISAALFLRDYREGAVVRHACDNTRCCNPMHLLMGTQADNIADRESRGRGNHEAKLWNIMAIAQRRRAKKTRTLSEPPAEGVGFEPT